MGQELTKHIGTSPAMQKIIDRFRNAPNSLGKAWKLHQSSIINSEKTRVRKADESWSKDGHAALEKSLPDIEKTLDKWQRHKEKNPFDSAGLAKLADQLAHEIALYKTRLQGPGSFSSVNSGLLTSGLEALAGEVGSQAKSLNDPVAYVTSGLDALGKEVLLPTSRNTFDSSLKNTPPDKFWSNMKTKITSKITDKAVAKGVDAVFDGALGKTLATWSSIMSASKIDRQRVGAVSQTLTDILARYDAGLSKVDVFGKGLNNAGSIDGLRDCLHAIAAKVSADIKWVATVGGFGNG